MDAIRKKMQSLKAETDQLYATIKKFEDKTAESNQESEQADCDIRDYGKKVHGLEIDFDETNDKLQKATESLEEKEMILCRFKCCIWQGENSFIIFDLPGGFLEHANIMYKMLFMNE